VLDSIAGSVYVACIAAAEVFAFKFLCCPMSHWTNWKSKVTFWLCLLSLFCLYNLQTARQTPAFGNPQLRLPRRIPTLMPPLQCYGCERTFARTSNLSSHQTKCSEVSIMRQRNNESRKRRQRSTSPKVNSREHRDSRDNKQHRLVSIFEITCSIFKLMTGHQHVQASNFQASGH
jgi:hypothetical protein